MQYNYLNNYHNLENLIILFYYLSILRSLSSSSDEYAKRIISDCSDNSDYEDSIVDIDVVISGGGLKGYFMVGATFILAKEMKKRNLR